MNNSSLPINFKTKVLFHRKSIIRYYPITLKSETFKELQIQMVINL